VSTLNSNRITREEVSAIIVFACIFLFLGGVAGWSARAVTSSDKFLISTATRHFTEAELLQKQIDQIVKEGSKAQAKSPKVK